MKINFQRAFTLIELLVVIAILGILTASTFVFLSNVLKSSNQAKIVSEIKQNGQTILDSIDRQVRNSASATILTPAPAGSTSAIQLNLADGTYLFLVCFDSVASPLTNGWIGIASSASASPPSSSAGYQALTNTDNSLGVDVDCSAQTFEVDGALVAPYPQIITIAFTLNQGVGSTARADFLAGANFKTTISLRKYSL